ncbi:MAG: glycosyltransferase family 4 protein [Anaerolineae bacterium]|nr:glycosyltransferase family 4 protein [Anaerolineae bacterium]
MKPKTIAILHYKVGGTDGVSLEIDKWKRVLEEMGHTVHLCAGDLGTVDGTLIPEMYHHTPEVERLYRNTFIALTDDTSEAEYRAELYALADVIERKFRAFVMEKGINFLIPQNIWSVAVNPAVAIAVTRVMRDLRLPALAHNHDFYWERTDGVAITCRAALEMAQTYLPPHDPLARHVVINSLGQHQMRARLGIEATVVPNIFDFDAPAWVADAYNGDFRERIGLKPNDVLILQATRIVGRKGIEMAVDFARALDTPARRAILKQRGLYNGRPFHDDSRIVLVLAGYAEDDQVGYVPKLKEKIARTGVDALFIEDLVSSRRETRNGEKLYSLWDTYVFADFVTYPSLWEGWGNQLLEALRAELPVMLFEYPVYRADIKDKGFRVVSLGSEVAGYDDLGLAYVAPDTIEAAADQAVNLLTDAQLRTDVMAHNFQVAKVHYSMDALRRYLAPLIEVS